MDFQRSIRNILELVGKNWKIFALIVGIPIILSTFFLITGGNYKLLGKIISPLIKIIDFGLPYLFGLILSSITVLWIPVIIYISISIITTSHWWRFFLCLVSLCSFLLVIKFIVFPNLSFSLSAVIKASIYLVDIYLLLLWTVPRAIWNWIGGVFWFLQSAIVNIMPDLPSNLDDFGMTAAIFAFIFLYLHTLASFLQTLVDSKNILNVKSWLFRDNSNKVA